MNDLLKDFGIGLLVNLFWSLISKIKTKFFPSKNATESESDSSIGGDGGSIFIFSNKLSGNGKISVNGGDGTVPGRGGHIHIQTLQSDFQGAIEANGGKKL